MPKKISRTNDLENYGVGWEKYVPIIVSDDKRSVDIYLHDMIQAPCNYSEAVHTIKSAVKGDVINLHINNGGGIVDSAFMVYAAIKESEAHVIANLAGIVASAATIITMACDEVRVAPYTQFMVHNYSGGTQGKGHEIKAYVKFADEELNRAFREIYKDFLTVKEMKEVIDGMDLWLNDKEVLERWDIREAARNSEEVVVQPMEDITPTIKKRVGRTSKTQIN